MSFPTQIELREREQTLTVTWPDGHAYTYALRYLRGWCPCASCQGHFAAQKTFIDGVDVRLETVEPVGSYAIRPVWGDGHQSGVFSVQYLRELEQGPPGDGPDNATCLAEAAAALSR